MAAPRPIHEFLKEIVAKLNVLLSIIRELPQTTQGVGMARAMLKRFSSMKSFIKRKEALFL